jgi:hypothetical protein
VTAPVLSDGLVGRVCLVRFRLRQGGAPDHKLEDETRKRAVSVPSWEEWTFIPRSRLAAGFDRGRPIEVSFALIDLVDQRELGQVSSTLPAEDATPLVLDDVTVKDGGRVVYRGRIALGETLERIQLNRTLPQGHDGELFADHGHQLPRKPKGHYRQYVLPTPHLEGPGPQRIVVGRDAEIFYSADGRRNFVRVR